MFISIFNSFWTYHKESGILRVCMTIFIEEKQQSLRGYAFMYSLQHSISLVTGWWRWWRWRVLCGWTCKGVMKAPRVTTNIEPRNLFTHSLVIRRKSISICRLNVLGKLEGHRLFDGPTFNACFFTNYDIFNMLNFDVGMSMHLKEDVHI